MSQIPKQGIEVTGTNDGHYPGIIVDMNDFSDQTMTLAALAPFADSPTTIRNIGHIRLQESDRLSAIAKELTKMGIRVEEGEEFLSHLSWNTTAIRRSILMRITGWQWHFP